MATSQFPDGPCTIGGASARTGCHIETIRYYERIGLLPRPCRSEGGHRIYQPDDLKRIGFIARSRSLGFALKEIADFLTLIDQGDYTCAEVKALTVAQIASVERKITDLERMKSGLEKLAEACDGGKTPDCPIVDELYG
ncbi:MAG TPA: helix-turn-helix domain-containing protein [Alphaproteobacteria bacterium]|nr:helix-turn-helix domain-containing protein [Alphaproteobacteria bacterium]